jgi:hypothetical protein
LIEKRDDERIETFSNFYSKKSFYRSRVRNSSFEKNFDGGSAHSSTERSKIDFKTNQNQNMDAHKKRIIMDEFNLNIPPRKSLVREPYSAKSSTKIVSEPVSLF